MGSLFGMPNTLIHWEVSGVKITLIRGALVKDDNAAIGIGTLIIFIAMILVAGMAASVIIQTMNSLSQQAMQTGQETIKDISSGLRLIQVNGYVDNSKIDQLAFFLKTTDGSDSIDLSYTYISLSDTSAKVILNYTSSCYSNNVSNGLFGTLNSSLLTSTTYGIIVVRDIDGSCTQTIPTINNEDMIVILVNTTKCFSGISPRTEVSGNIVPEFGISGIIDFTTPSVFIDKIIELQ